MRGLPAVVHVAMAKKALGKPFSSFAVKKCIRLSIKPIEAPLRAIQGIREKTTRSA
jgi:hypothetical protein